MEVDVLHPLTEWDWQEQYVVTDLEEVNSVQNEDVGYSIMSIKNVQCAILRDTLYIYCTAGSRVKNDVVFMSTDLKQWSSHYAPRSNGAFIAHKDLLLMIGGRSRQGKYLDKAVLCSFNGFDWEVSSLPILPEEFLSENLRAVSNDDLVCVSSTFIRQWPSTQYDELNLCVLLKNHWYTVELPMLPTDYKTFIPVFHLTIAGGELFVHTEQCVYHCALESLVAQARNSRRSGILRRPPITRHQYIRNNLWDELPMIDYPGHLISFGKHLIGFDKSAMVYALSLLTKSWVQIANTPDHIRRIQCAAIHPSGDLLLVCGDQIKLCVSRVKMRVSSYDPDSRFSMSSLARLEAAGIKVVAILERHLKSIEIFTDTITWAQLLGFIVNVLKLKELGQQIEAHLTGLTTNEYLDAYRQILATHECLEMWFFKVILLGAPRLGKTTMRRRLTGEIDDISSSGEGEQPSTGIVESGCSIVIRNLSSTTALITESEWIANKDLTEEACAILQYFYSHISEKKAVQSSTDVSNTAPSPSSEVKGEDCNQVSGIEIQVSDFVSASSDSEDTTSADVVSSKPTPSAPAPASSDHDSYTPPPEYAFSIPEMIRNAVSPKCWREITQVCRDTAFLNMGDTGGQPEFMDMQPALTVGPALYLFFCKLTDDLDSLYKVSYLSPSTGESTVPRESAYTAKEVLFTSLASIACFKSSSSTSLGETTSSTADQLLASCNESIAYIIGTHKDLVSEEQIDEFDEKLQQSIRPTNFFKEDIVQFSSEERMVLPVDNMHGGSSEVDWVRKILEESLKKHFKKLSIPASWFILSLCLRKREERTASLESVLQLASELGIPEKEAMVALWFLHHYAGVLMYFPNPPELKDTVICDNQIIYDSATNLIVNTFKFRSVGKAASERFRKTGQFSLKDIRRATAGVSGDYIPLEKLVKLLAYLNILVSFVQSTSTSLSSRTPSSEEMYFMPSALLNATHEEMASWWGDTHKQVSPAPLFITYQCGFVPVGVFPAMIANLTAERPLKLRVKGIRKNRVEFQFGRDFDMITLVSQPTYYAVHISRRKSTKTPTHEVCAIVRWLVESTLKTVTSRMNYTFTAEYQLGFECPSHPGREYLCVVDSDDPSPHVMCCQEDMDDLEAVDMLNQHLVWFGECKPFVDVGGTEILPAAQTTISLTLLNHLKWADEQEQEQEFRLVENVSAKWRKFGTYLGLKSNQLDAWDRQYRGDANECWNKVMDDWLTRGGSCGYPATWEGLYSLLNDLGFRNISRNMQRAVAGFCAQ